MDITCLTQLHPEPSKCRHCGSFHFKKNGFFTSLKQSYRCSDCGRKFSARGMGGRCDMRIDIGKVIAFISHIDNGLSSRQASRLVGISKDTGTAILWRIGYIRKCRKCGNPLTGNRFLFCSDDCQEWRGRSYSTNHPKKPPSIPLRGATENVLRYVTNFGCESHVSLALNVANSISEFDSATYLGPCFEGIALGCQSGIVDDRVLRRMAMDSVKRYWKEIKTFRVGSLDAMKESIGFEPMSTSRDY